MKGGRCNAEKWKLVIGKLMRDDPADHADACFIVENGGMDIAAIEKAMREARVPAVEEIREAFAAASDRLLRFIRKSANINRK